MDNTQEKEEFETTVRYVTGLLSSSRSNFSVHKMGATVIGIRTNISGTLKLHTYVLLFPFMKNETIVPYTTRYPNISIQDICFHVDEPFYGWLYEEMKKQNSMVILSLESNCLTVLPRGDALIVMDYTNEKKGMEFGLEFGNFEQWYQAKPFPNIFNLIIAHPYLYMVPFPLKPILIQTKRDYNGNFITIQ